MPILRSLPIRRLSSVLAAAGVVVVSSACGEDPLVVTGRVDVTVATDLTLVVDFPTATTLVRSPRPVNANLAGECTVERDAFSILIASDESSTGIRSFRVSSDEASVDIGGVTYTRPVGVGCLIETRASDPGYGTITFDIDCALQDEEGDSVSAVGALSFEGCH